MESRFLKTNERRVLVLDDGYGWQHIDCFNKPASIILDSFSKGLHDDFLFNVCFYHSYLIGGWYPNLFEDDPAPESYFEEFYHKKLEDKYSVLLKDIYFKDCMDMEIQIKNTLDNGGVCLVPCDVYELYYYDDYLKNHIDHYFIVEGYDAKRRLFLIVDTLHVNQSREAEYRPFYIPCEKLYKLSSNYYERYYSKIEQRYFWCFKRSDTAKEYDAHNLLKGFKEDLDNILSGSVKIENVEKECIARISDACENGNTEEVERNIAHIFKRGNYRVIFYDILFKALKACGKDTGELEILKDRIMEKWGDIKNLITYNVATCKYEFENVLSEIEANINEDSKLLANLQKILVEKVI